MNTSQNQFSIGIDGSYKAIETPKYMLINNSSWRRSEGASLLRGR